MLKFREKYERLENMKRLESRVLIDLTFIKHFAVYYSER